MGPGRAKKKKRKRKNTSEKPKDPARANKIHKNARVTVNILENAMFTIIQLFLKENVAGILGRGSPGDSAGSPAESRDSPRTVSRCPGTPRPPKTRYLRCTLQKKKVYAPSNKMGGGGGYGPLRETEHGEEAISHLEKQCLLTRYFGNIFASTTNPVLPDWIHRRWS